MCDSLLKKLNIVAIGLFGCLIVIPVRNSIIPTANRGLEGFFDTVRGYAASMIGTWI
jgi:hypothetical protein